MVSNGRTKKQWFHPRLLTDEIMTGLLLSDASLLKQKNEYQNSQFQLSQSIKNKGLIDFVEHYLNEIGFSTYRKTYHRCMGTVVNLNSERHPVFTELRKIWYPDDKKIVPDSLKLTPKTIAYWFMGDGSSTWYKRGNKKVHVNIATDGFTTNDVIGLQGSLHEMGMDMSLRFRIGGSRPYLETKKSEDIYKFMTMVKPFMVPCFYYKVKIPSLNTKTGCIPLWKRDKTRKKCSVNSCIKTARMNKSTCHDHKALKFSSVINKPE